MAGLPQEVLAGIRSAKADEAVTGYPYDRVPEAEIAMQVLDCMEANGIIPRDKLTLQFDTEQIVRFPVVGDKGGEKSGWYRLYSDGCPAGTIGDWRGDSLNFKFDFSRLGQNYEHIRQQAQKPEFQAEAKRIQEERDKRQQEAQARMADEARVYFDNAKEAPDDHAYLVKKGVVSHGLRIDGGGNLLVPMYGAGGNIQTLQRIFPDGTKRFWEGASAKGAFYVVEEGEAPRAVLVVEGYATAASVAESLGAEYKVVMAANAGNLKAVCQTLKQRYPALPVFILGDDDAGTARKLDRTGKSKPNTGREKAAECLKAGMADNAIFPEFDREKDGWIPSDWNDYAELHGKEATGRTLRDKIEKMFPKQWLRPIGDLLKEMKSPHWLIRDWIPENAAIMLFGASGAGKSFIAIDMALSIACPEISKWHGREVKHAPVVYLAGEGQDGITRRVAGWLLHNGINEAPPMYVTGWAIDLDTPETGGAQTVIDEIKGQGITPGLIIIDTLHRHMAGDENKAQDTRAMLEACAKLQREFSCSVLLIHHTGVVQDAKDRARGSSAWRGAMDIELKVVKEDPESAAVALGQTKNKDAACAETLMFEQVTVELPIKDDYGRPVTTAVIEKSESTNDDGGTRAKPLSQAEKKIYFAKKTFIDAAMKNPIFSEGKEFLGVKLDDWRVEFYRQATQDTTEGKKKAFQRAREQLIEKGLLEKTQLEAGTDFYIPLGGGVEWPELLLNAPFKNWEEPGSSMEGCAEEHTLSGDDGEGQGAEIASEVDDSNGEQADGGRKAWR